VTNLSLVLALGVFVGCSSNTEEPISDAITLDCPVPGELPFHLMSHGFQSSTNSDLVADSTRNKDEASDIFGDPSGAQANVYLDDAATPAAGPADYQGAKARTPPDQGLFSHGLAGENVSLWFYDGSAWNMLARGQTDENGAYDLQTPGFVAPNAEPVFSVLEADESCAAHYSYLMPAGSKVIVVDIDGTLTTADSELIMEVADENYVPKMMTAANTMAQAWAAKGYPIVYLTARPHVFDVETRAWLDMLEFPKGPLITELGGETADAYKTIWLQRMIADFGWTIFAAYGNAATDITAYANVAVPGDHTFIIGGLGGGGTVAIPGNDYTDHIATFIAAQPDNQ
jgi:hypothetical protein